jgi:anthranilate synthase/aminodeoxychorismate synthase-like glutamine amidotransferase
VGESSRYVAGIEIGDNTNDMILLIDNYDSFVHNLARYFQRLGQQTVVVRNDAMTIDEIRELKPAAIVLSPGPCVPETAGISLEVVTALSGEFPILGICLGHQAIGQAFGGDVILAAEPVHGRISSIEHDRRGVFANVPQGFAACRYHSLVLDRETLPDALEVSATLADETLMAIRHREHCVVGLQFHPESVLTSNGYLLLANFLKMAGVDVPNNNLTLDNERHLAVEPTPDDANRIVTF